MRHSTLYTILFATIVCVVCGVMVSGAAVSLKDQQDFNSALDKRKKVLEAAGIAKPGEDLTAEQVEAAFANVESAVVELETGKVVPDIDPAAYNARKAKADPQASKPAPPNQAGLTRVADHAAIYILRGEGGDVELLVLPIEGVGLWGLMYGFLALDADLQTVRGLTYYEHKETPGLGGEVDNPSWKARWPGRKVFEDGEVALSVIKGPAPPPAAAPYQVDGLSGATFTARGVTNMLQFWLSDTGFGPFLERFRAGEIS
ncbi:MAG TPA: Na(+)-translocating NADH-quinone reductase subunit C [Thermoanaerobaculia bacterium]|nr:Na(+)-translocating NADH-quinone reductase subunit C [Thermoanaerobaculia bacterium]